MVKPAAVRAEVTHQAWRVGLLCGLQRSPGAKGRPCGACARTCLKEVGVEEQETVAWGSMRGREKPSR